MSHLERKGITQELPTGCCKLQNQHPSCLSTASCLSPPDTKNPLNAKQSHSASKAYHNGKAFQSFTFYQFLALKFTGNLKTTAHEDLAFHMGGQQNGS